MSVRCKHCGGRKLTPLPWCNRCLTETQGVGKCGWCDRDLTEYSGCAYIREELTRIDNHEQVHHCPSCKRYNKETIPMSLKSKHLGVDQMRSFYECAKCQTELTIEYRLYKPPPKGK